MKANVVCGKVFLYDVVNRMSYLLQDKGRHYHISTCFQIMCCLLVLFLVVIGLVDTANV